MSPFINTTPNIRTGRIIRCRMSWLKLSVGLSVANVVVVLLGRW